MQEVFLSEFFNLINLTKKVGFNWCFKNI